jgi:hypothetical protein
MSRLLIISAGLSCFTITSSTFAQSWITYTNQTSTRLIADTGIGATDPEEKDFTYGDYDHDGDIDLVSVRKQPFTTSGRKRAVLYMNEGIADGQALDGVLVDRTGLYATAATDGGQGFLDLCANRDVASTDVNSDGWLDLVTAPTYGQGLAKTISHPRIYINLGEIDGVWQGFKYEEPRFPNLGGAPNFCGVGAGDVNGDKAPDLYFVDYDNVTPSPFDDRLMINDGNGNFTDQSTARMTATMLTSAFGISAEIVDMNGDGWLDVVKNENGPTKTHYNAGNGFFTVMQNTYGGASYFASTHDLNQDGKLDIVVSDDGIDRYLLNTGTPGPGQATFTQMSFPASSSGFGSSSRYADLNQDGKVDVLIADVDVDAPGCTRQLRMYRNLGNLPNVTLTEQGSGGIPVAQLTGTHDIAPIDLNQDNYPDLVIGRCNSISVWINTPPSGLTFNYPQGLPGFIPSNVAHSFEVQVGSIGGITPQPNTGTFNYSINGGSFTSVPMTVVSGNLYSATIPPTACTDLVNFFVTAQGTNSVVYRDPPGSATYSAVSAAGTQITLEDGLEGDVTSWTINNHASLTAGGWQAADPNGTINAGSVAAPEDDNGAGYDVKAFITQDGAPGGGATVADVDGGPTELISPIIDLAGTDATISYDRWFYCEDVGTADADVLKTEISNNGGTTWAVVHQTDGTGSSWESVNFRVGQYVAPTSQVRLRFTTSDSPNNSVTEAGIDNLTVDELVCTEPCAADVSGDGTVNVDDLLAVIAAWGATSGPADVDQDGIVNVNDLLLVIGAWGSCA